LFLTCSLYRILFLLLLLLLYSFKNFFEEKRKEGGQKGFYIFFGLYFLFKTFTKNIPLLPFFLLNFLIATQPRTQYGWSDDSMMRGNGHTNFCELCVNACSPGRLITTIFPRIYARTYYAHPRARVMSFSPALAAFKSHVELLPRVAAYLKSDRRGYYEGNSMM